MFTSFRSRITRSYVLLALALIVVLVGATSAMALVLFSRGMNDSLAGASQRASEAAAQALASGETFAQAAPSIVHTIGRSRFRVRVVDLQGHTLAENERDGPPSAGLAIVVAIGHAVGLPHVRVPVSGGSIAIDADFDRFGELLLWYWSIVLPLGLIAVAAAWLIGRRITARAVGPLVDVTGALHVVASGDFSPRRLPSEHSDLQELTSAYNEVAYSLAAATAQRERTEAQMRQFVADAGHELRTPLTIIMGYLDVLQQGIVRDGEGMHRTYETMLDESRKMRALIEKLILLARLDRTSGATQLTPVDLSGVVRRVAATLDPLAGGRIQVDAPDESPFVLGDESELYEAVKNCVDNALKYAAPSPVRVKVRSQDGEVCVSIEDEGPGMDAQDAEHAFDRFYRGAARSQADGSGLGLAIARRAAERAGGTATLRSASGEGTAVILCLPVAAPKHSGEMGVSRK